MEVIRIERLVQQKERSRGTSPSSDGYRGREKWMRVIGRSPELQMETSLVTKPRNEKNQPETADRSTCIGSDLDDTMCRSQVKQQHTISPQSP